MENGLLTLTAPNHESRRCYPFSLSISEKIKYCSASPGNDYTSELHFPFQIMHAIECYIIGMKRPMNSTSLPTLGDPPTIEVALKYNDLEGNPYAETFTIKIYSYYIPDNVGSKENPLSTEHYSKDNVRADLRFEVI